MSAADPTTERYAAIMDSLISDCTRLEEQQLSDSGCSHIRRSHHPLATSS